MWISDKVFRKPSKIPIGGFSRAHQDQLPRPSFACLFSNRHFTLGAFQRGVFAIFLWTKADIRRFGGKMPFAWTPWLICTLLINSCLNELSHRCIKHCTERSPFLHCWLLVQVVSVILHSCWSWLSGPHTAHLYYPPPPLSQLLLPLSVVIFILLGFTWLMTTSFSTCMCLRSCSAWWDARWSGLSKPWPPGSCMLGKGLAHFHHATLLFSTKAFTSNCSSPLPKKKAVFLPSNKSECSTWATPCSYKWQFLTINVPNA